MESKNKNSLIVLLLGTSTAGKSTICRALLEENTKLPIEQQLDWQIDGQDILLDRKFYNELKDIENFKEIQRLQPRFQEVKTTKNGNPEVRELYIAIVEGKLVYKNISLNLIDESEFEEQCVAFLEATGDLYGKEFLEKLKLLTTQKQQNLIEIAKNQNQYGSELFDQAIQNSRNNKPTIIDIAPSKDSDKVIDFINHIKRNNHNCPVHIALIHLPMQKLAQRLEERNRKARDRGEESDVRGSLGPFIQYSYLFGPQKEEDGKTVIGEITKSDLISIVNKFGDDSDKGRKKAIELMHKFGFLDYPQGSSNVGSSEDMAVKIVPISSFDKIYSTESISSSREIAEDILQLASQQRKPIKVSYAERMQSGKYGNIGSKGGFNEL